jgi:DNA polymerase III subunit alpha
MRNEQFVHLHLHTEYSIMHSTIHIDPLLKKVKSFSMPGLAITDHMNMFGCLQFLVKARHRGIKPIIGCEIDLALDCNVDIHRQSRCNRHAHLILLVENQKGYQNLSKLLSGTYFRGSYKKPLVDKKLLENHNRGLIALSGCLKGEIPQAIIAGDVDNAIMLAEEYKSIFDNERFFLEIQENGFEKQKRVNQALVEISQKHSLPIVATSNCHYLNPEDALAHKVLLYLRSGQTISTADQGNLQTGPFYVKSPNEMQRDFASVPEAIKNTISIAERCNFELDKAKSYFIPRFVPPDNQTSLSYFEKKARDGLDKRLKKLFEQDSHKIEKLTASYYRRLETEIEIIKASGFTDYFLIISDIVNFAKQNGILLGPGRGSAPGSLVCYALHITEIDPIPHGLIFEQFLNPKENNLPVINIDVADKDRERVICYIVGKYGNDCVARIAAFDRMKPKDVIFGVGRVLKTERKIAKLTLDQPIHSVQHISYGAPEMKELINNDKKLATVINTSILLEGLVQKVSVHGTGIVISDIPLANYLPLYRDQNGQLLTQFIAKDVDKLRFVKFDLVGLKELSVIDRVIKLIKSKSFHPVHDKHNLRPRENKTNLPDVYTFLPDDKRTFDLICSGGTEDIVFLKSVGVRDFLTKLKPESIDDIAALLALYRPDSFNLGVEKDFINRRNGVHPVLYDLSSLEPILRKTYGVIIFTEQVIEIARAVANLSEADADRLQRSTGKKPWREKKKAKEMFFEDAAHNGIPTKKIKKLYYQIDKFGGCAMQKSHALGCAYLICQLAYLKAHFPDEFYNALLPNC